MELMRIDEKVGIRQIFDNLIFDPEHTIVDKTHLITKCEETIIAMYDNIIKRTGKLNFDELVIEIIQRNHELIQFAAQQLWNSPEANDLPDEISSDLLYCDVGRWMDNVEKAEVSAYVPISNFIAKTLTKYGRAFIPYMEERYENHCAYAFGVQGQIVVNDCQNVLFDSMIQSENIERVELGELERVQCIRSFIDDFLLEAQYA